MPCCAERASHSHMQIMKPTSGSVAVLNHVQFRAPLWKGIVCMCLSRPCYGCMSCCILARLVCCHIWQCVTPDGLSLLFMQLLQPAVTVPFLQASPGWPPSTAPRAPLTPLATILLLSQHQSSSACMRCTHQKSCCSRRLCVLIHHEWRDLQVHLLQLQLR